MRREKSAGTPLVGAHPVTWLSLHWPGEELVDGIGKFEKVVQIRIGREKVLEGISAPEKVAKNVERTSKFEKGSPAIEEVVQIASRVFVMGVVVVLVMVENVARAALAVELVVVLCMLG